jgi:hypothetical protein
MELIGDNYHVMGTGFTIINFPAEEITNPDYPENTYLSPTQEAKKRIDEKIEYIKNGRGEIISGCYDLEHELGQFISDFFLKDNPKKQEIFHELILDTTFLSFAQKKNIARLIVKKYPDVISSNFSEEGRKKIFTELENVIKKRNALAHGDVVIDLNNDISTIQYYDSNKNQKSKFEITPEFFRESRTQIGGLALTFWILTKESFEKPIIIDKE